jgi:hypothetical protein
MEHTDPSPIGLDIGTSRIIAAQRSGEEYTFSAELNAFVTIPYSSMTENVLKKENVPHTVRNSSILVHGNESERFADLLDTETRRPMTRGLLNPTEPDNVTLIRQLITSTIGQGAKQGQTVCFSVPAAPAGCDDNLTYHEATLRQVLTDLGYNVKSINEGLAVIYSELESSNYTGIGVSCGGGLCNVCLAYLSVPVVSFSIPKAGDYIDSSAAAVTGERANRIRITKEDSFHFNGRHADKIHQVLGVYYDEVIQSLLISLKDAFSSSRSLPRLGRPAPLVLSGGSVMPQGFRDRFEKLLREGDFPIPVSDVRLAEQPLFSTAKGALVAALADR